MSGFSTSRPEAFFLLFALTQIRKTERKTKREQNEFVSFLLPVSTLRKKACVGVHSKAALKTWVSKKLNMKESERD
jgi:hypothetical protein